MSLFQGIYSFYFIFIHLVILAFVFVYIFIEQENNLLLPRENQIRSTHEVKKLKFFIDHGTFNPAFTNTTPYEIILSPEEDFENIEVIFGLKTVFENRYNRDKIRKSFGNPELYRKKYKVRFLFLLGKDGKYDENLIFDEQLLFDDILYGSFKDSYWNLTYKEIMFYTWTEQNAPNVKFIYRGDDDNFLNPLGLMKFFGEHWKEANGEPALWGGLLEENMSILSLGKTAEEIRKERKAEM